MSYVVAVLEPDEPDEHYMRLVCACGARGYVRVQRVVQYDFRTLVAVCEACRIEFAKEVGTDG